MAEFLEDGKQRRRSDEWHFSWVLEGRAIQDVWIVPKRGERDPARAIAELAYYGTTLRVYDPRIDAWHIRWTDPVAQAYLSQIGRRDGSDIAQEGKDALGKKRAGASARSRRTHSSGAAKFRPMTGRPGIAIWSRAVRVNVA